jgi:putative sterol carrier protein
VRYFSDEYFQELARRLNADSEWSKKAATLTTRITLTVTDRATSYLLDIAGGAVTARKVAAEDPADFKFEGPYEIWGKIAAGTTDFNTAVITGKMKFRGSLPKIMGIQSQMGRLTQIAKDIPAEV